MDAFYQQLTEPIFQKWKLKKVIVNIERQIWKCFFSITEISSDVKQLKLFVEQFQAFVFEHNHKFIRDLKIVIYFDLISLDLKYLQKIIDDIYLNSKYSPAFELFLKKIVLIDLNWSIKKLDIKIDPFFKYINPEGEKKPHIHWNSFLKYLKTILSDKYGLHLELKPINETLRKNNVVTLSKEELILNLNNASDKNKWITTFECVLDHIIAEEPKKIFLNIFRHNISKIDFQQKVCEFSLSEEILTIKDYVFNLRRYLLMLEQELKIIYHLPFELRIENMPKINLNSSDKEIPELSFKDIPCFNDNQLKSFRKEFSIFQIKGYVQKPQYIETKGKSVLFSFYLVDVETKQDSIVYRRFLDDKTEQLEQIKKDFREGVLVKIRSIIDNYSKKQDFYFNFDAKRKDNLKTAYHIIDKTPFMMQRKDNYPGKKRIEFHLHTKMSNLDAITGTKDYIETALRWGHEAIAFTDHNGLYAYPEIAKCTQNQKIKPILGVEADYIEEKPLFITNQEILNDWEDFELKNHNYVVFDIETTGFSKIHDNIIEISAVKIENGRITDKEFSELVNPGPEVQLTSNITQLTNIRQEDLMNKPSLEEVLPKFLEFIKNSVLVAHNAKFDIDFLEEKIKKLNLKLKKPLFIDTLALSQKFFSKYLKYFSLKRLIKAFKIKIDTKPEEQQYFHRALFDAKATALVLITMLGKLANKEGVEQEDGTFKKALYLSDLKGKINGFFERSYHINILARNQKGYQNLFCLISESLTTDFYKKPRMLKSKLNQYREGLLIGSGCFESNVFDAALNKSDEELAAIINEYDYIEVQPPHSYKHIMYELGGIEVQSQTKSLNRIQNTILKIIHIAKKQKKIVIATGDVHYLHPHEKIYREIYINAKLIGGGLHRLSKYQSEHLPDNYLMTTQEMLDAFSFITDDRLREEIVIHNTHLLNDKIEQIQIFPQELFFLKDDAFEQNLKIPSIEKEMKNLIQKKITNLYGKIIHPVIRQRITKELNSILGTKDNEFTNKSIAPIYYLTHLLVKKSNEDYFPVGSRGSIGSSLIANILEITEVNPLKPHYLCPKCHYTVMQMTDEEKKDENYQEYITKISQKHNKLDTNSYNDLRIFLSGYDLPDAFCPFCDNIKFKKDGQDIPFETFLGFEGNKTPDIDLNFSGDYQSTAHNYIKSLIGDKHVYRAGTIQTVAKQYAFGYVKGFIKDKKLESQTRSCEIYRRASIIEGVKRSTGQHPGGIVIVPKEITIYQVTPVQFPANDTTSIWKTTHFDYHSFENNLFKMDILGHDDPMLIKFFMDYVRENPQSFDFQHYRDIPIDDPNVYKIFSSNAQTFQTNEEYAITSLAIPEFGTNFVQKMLENIYKKEQKNFNFATLVKVSGLSHGTDVWSQNAQDIINQKGDFEEYEKKISFSEIISCRDEIMITLIQQKISPLQSFQIMEFVRKGKQHTEPTQWLELIKPLKGKIEDWYLKSLSKIKYLFPKAHAVAYVLMAIRIAWFKVHHPLLFYSGYFSKRADQFDYELMLQTNQKIEEKINSLEKQVNTQKTTIKEQNLINTLKNSLEMLKRGYKFLPIDLNKSEANTFVILPKHKALLMPFITIDGLGQVMADKIVNTRKEKPFTQEDFVKRVKLNKTILKKFQEELNLIDKLPID
ncbi:PolC-type DNA polymerase III [Candidatus Phytoplasma phoenicium]|uniref:DNA polymerase III PolC-type n=1 Tax=Candidatus Phytoplasma phoenicium TaxID=198422 RepID=A0A2S8NV32_9MOLU|nr:PolC-type DNA polymerase III [Candidatus Phytoplasma phoenicium]